MTGKCSNGVNNKPVITRVFSNQETPRAALNYLVFGVPVHQPALNARDQICRNGCGAAGWMVPWLQPELSG
jgi:hypothetical protein